MNVADRHAMLAAFEKLAATHYSLGSVPAHTKEVIWVAAVEYATRELKERLVSFDAIKDGGDLYAHGSTETGFYPDKVVDYEALCAEIDKFSATFRETK